MSQKNKVFHYFILICISLILICFLFILSKSGIFKIDLFNLASLLGTITTCIAFLVGCYFAFLAIDAYSHLQNIRNIENDILTKVNPIKASLEDASKESLFIIKNMAEMMDEFISDQINIDQYGITSSIMGEELRGLTRTRRNNLLATRARILIKYKFMNPERRAILIRELSEVGIKSDLDILKNIADSADESDEIRKNADNSRTTLAERVKKGKT